MALVIGLVAASWRVLFRCTAKLARLGDRLLTAWFFLIFLIYPTTSQKVFSTFNCEEFDDERRSRALMQDFAIDCDGARHVAYTTYALFMFVYPFGIPLLYAYLLLWRHGATMSRLRANEALRDKVLSCQSEPLFAIIRHGPSVHSSGMRFVI